MRSKPTDSAVLRAVRQQDHLSHHATNLGRNDWCELLSQPYSGRHLGLRSGWLQSDVAESAGLSRLLSVSDAVFQARRAKWVFGLAPMGACSFAQYTCWQIFNPCSNSSVYTDLRVLPSFFSDGIADITRARTLRVTFPFPMPRLPCRYRLSTVSCSRRNLVSPVKFATLTPTLVLVLSVATR